LEKKSNELAVKLGNKLKKNLQFELFLIPALFFYTLFIIVPLFQGFGYSVTNLHIKTRATDFVGLKNFIDILGDDIIKNSISFTFMYTLATVVLVTAAAIPLALVFDANSHTKNLQRAIFYFPSCVSALIMGFTWRYLLSSDDGGFVNSIIINVFHGHSVNWLSDPVIAQLSNVLVCIWIASGWNATIYLAYLQSIPHEYYEAAYIDGASYIQRVRHITLPLLAPAMTISVMTLLTGGLKLYELPYALTDGGPMRVTHTFTHAIVVRGITEGNYGRASALAVVLFIIIMVFTYVQVSVMSKREEKAY